MREVTFEQTSVTSFSVYEFGNGKGPRIAVTAAVHGDEQTAIHAAMLLIKQLENQTINGFVKIIPICNPASFRNRTRVSPFDRIDMNRIFPGSAEGSPTMQLAHAIWQETRDVDYLVDLHCIGAGGTSYTLALYREYPELRELAHALSLPIVIQSSGVRGQLFVESCRSDQKALIIELPAGQPGGTIDVPAAEECCQAILRYLKHLGLLASDFPVSPDSPVTFYAEITSLTAPRPGLFLPIASAGSSCAEGELLGTFDGSAVTAPFAGVITSVSPPRYCFAGENLADVAPVERIE
ncbi:succinylglutamate desuccinylase/aspartoacylase family protein [Brevibacillus sp. SYSU BS000544]|uniref:succinylglutamate desuccinylase/aspartoacylase family protein n=1 Tax=Brevibacillus sp. SYSU BS000544 TaxID=3416443 RepID=UPI003CE4D7A6